MIIHDVTQNEDEWFKLRCGIPTASNASKLITSKGAPSKSMPGYAMELAGNLFAGCDLNAWDGSQYTDRGHEIEPNARSAYELQKGVDVEEVGFITDNLYGCSPDGLVGEEGLLEIKCLPKNHIKALMYYDKCGLCPPEYLAQCQMQLFVTGRKWNDIMFYHDHLPSLIIRHEPDEVLFAELRKQLIAVIAERDRIIETLNKF